MYDAEGFAQGAQQFRMTLEQLRDGQRPSGNLRENLIRTMMENALLSQHIKTIDHFSYSDLWELLA